MRSATTVVPLTGEMHISYDVDDDGVAVTGNRAVYMQVKDGSATVVKGIGTLIRAALDREIEAFVQAEEDELDRQARLEGWDQISREGGY